jgi:predicted RNase H-like HicB family nuclease
MKKTRVENIVWKEGKYYVAQCLNVDISSFGKTKTEALKMLGEALELYFDEPKNAKIQRVERPQIVRSVIQHA